MRDFLSSPRRRRRLGWTLGSLLVVGGLAAVALAFWNTGETLDSPLEADTAPVETTPVAALRVTPAVRTDVSETVQEFARTAVLRRDLADAWRLASPRMREGLTLAEWQTGDIPVQPYPAKAFQSADWRLRYAYEHTVGIDVMVQPKPRSGAPVMVYSAELTEAGKGVDRRFLVDYWITQTTLGAAAAPERPAGRGGAPQPQLIFDEGRLGPEWFLVPAAIGLLLVLTLAGVLARGIVQRRRAERRYREQFGRS